MRHAAFSKFISERFAPRSGRRYFGWPVPWRAVLDAGEAAAETPEFVAIGLDEEIEAFAVGQLERLSRQSIEVLREIWPASEFGGLTAADIARVERPSVRQVRQMFAEMLLRKPLKKREIRWESQSVLLANASVR
jgi:hypothetical protein